MKPRFGTRRERLVLWTVVLTLAAAPLAAQKEPAETFENLVEVSEVLIDVLATDAEGHVVRGLTQDDFIVEERGEPVKLTGFSYYTTRYGDEGSAAGEVPASRYFVLFFHDPVPNAAYQARRIRQKLVAARDAQSWIETGLSGSDWVAVVSWDSRLKVHQDFTQDRQALVFAIEQAMTHGDPEKLDPRRPTPAAGLPSLLRHLPSGKALRRESQSMNGTLSLLAGALGYIVGRKNLLLFTHGFGQSDEVAQERYRFPERDPKIALNDHNVAVYPIHLGGRGSGQPQSGYLAELAESTGGFYYENLDEFVTPLTTIGDESFGYYVLSYQSHHPAGEIGYEEIEVRARDESIRIRARRGYRYGL